MYIKLWSIHNIYYLFKTNINNVIYFDDLINEKLSRLSKNKTTTDIAKLHNASSAKIKAQLKRGKKVEKERGGTISKAKDTALDHLVEDQKYYTKLKKAKL